MDIRKNVGTADRVIRFVVAAGLIGLLVTHTIAGDRGSLFGWACVAVLVLTALDETCPVYILFGLNTRREARLAKKQNNH